MKENNSSYLSDKFKNINQVQFKDFVFMSLQKQNNFNPELLKHKKMYIHKVK